jgi:hypothetical protein
MLGWLCGTTVHHGIRHGGCAKEAKRKGKEAEVLASPSLVHPNDLTHSIMPYLLRLLPLPNSTIRPSHQYRVLWGTFKIQTIKIWTVTVITQHLTWIFRLKDKMPQVELILSNVIGICSLFYPLNPCVGSSLLLPWLPITVDWNKKLQLMWSLPVTWPGIGGWRWQCLQSLSHQQGWKIALLGKSRKRRACKWHESLISAPGGLWMWLCMTRWGLLRPVLSSIWDLGLKGRNVLWCETQKHTANS